MTDITSSSVPSVKRVNGSDPAALVQKAVEGQQQAAKRKNMVIKRLPTFEFQEFRKNEMDAGRLGELTGGGEWDKMAIMKINRRSAPKVRYSPCLGFRHSFNIGRAFLHWGKGLPRSCFRTEFIFVVVCFRHSPWDS